MSLSLCVCVCSACVARLHNTHVSLSVCVLVNKFAPLSLLCVLLFVLVLVTWKNMQIQSTHMARALFCRRCRTLYSYDSLFGCGSWPRKNKLTKKKKIRRAPKKYEICPSIVTRHDREGAGRSGRRKVEGGSMLGTAKSCCYKRCAMLPSYPVADKVAKQSIL